MAGIKAIGIKDIEGNNVGISKHTKIISKDFWKEFEHINTSWVIGDGMAKMIVKRKNK